MKIHIDIGHPAHVHYFRNFVAIMQSRGHEFFITARDKDVAHNLLQAYEIEFSSRGKGQDRLVGKLLYIFKADFILFKLAKNFNPDIFLSFSSPYAAHVSKLLGKPHVAFDDTEHAKLGHYFYEPFTDVILSPSCFYAPFSKKQIFFDAYLELCYLHPKYFTPSGQILSTLGIEKKEKYTVLRFVSWKANHDIGLNGLSLENKINAVNEFSKYGKVIISAELELPEELEKYKLNISPEKIHHVLGYASLFYGESATMASESALLGTPAIYIDNVGRGYTNEQEEKYGLVFNFSSSEEDQQDSIKKGVAILSADKMAYRERTDKLIADKINPTDFLIWFIENYPKSIKTMRETPEYQYNFKH